ncbi:hypothetical protein VTK56DRAFT_5531 [Thermocarpiscus australiensis]
MLEVNNTGIGTLPGSLTYYKAKSYFAAWALLKSVGRSWLMCWPYFRSRQERAAAKGKALWCIQAARDPEYGAAIKGQAIRRRYTSAHKGEEREASIVGIIREIKLLISLVSDSLAWPSVKLYTMMGRIDEPFKAVDPGAAQP